MPFANLKVPAGTLTSEQKETLIGKVTDLYAATFGEAVRDNTMVLVDEVVDGGWGLRGEVLTLAKIAAQSQPQAR
ncbi:tautomerase family protein [Lentzea nigeriaca]|uniref:tautomerase family protein n=1 Tax=Lentzea nigeriaca TaxID=1128665 RepID=UPI00195B4233|nr:tautomerase family protein [Lentzea nigeriaca]MBM7857212.1 4-oxalocrotonate tautomerase [Lentzea nigeriaca]